MGIGDAAAVAAYRGGWRAVRFLPDAAAYRLFDQIADTAWRRQTKGARRLRANLARVVPDVDDATLDQLTRDGLRSYFRYWCDAFRLPDWTAERINRLEVHAEHVLRDALATGHGAVGALPHIGNWDHAGAWVTSHGMAVTTVAERLEPEAVYRQFLEFREGLGMTIYPLTGGDVDVMTRLAEHVAGNDFVPLLADRDLTARGIPVTFFGEEASMPAGPAALALRTGAPLIPVTTWFEGTGPDHALVLQFETPVSVPVVGTDREKAAVMTQHLADVFALRIAEHPTDWHMLQKLFTADLDPR
jgi:KDO2-lipid IV(A) lauroyltransferase